MWQRVQTLYLAIATGLVVALFFSTMAVAIGSDGALAPIKYTESTPFLCLMIGILVVNFLALVTFKSRVLQYRLTVLVSLLLIGFQAWLAVRYFTAPDGIVFKFTAVFPIVAAIFDILAARGILSDQLMVESFSRLRSKKKK